MGFPCGHTRYRHPSRKTTRIIILFTVLPLVFRYVICLLDSAFSKDSTSHCRRHLIGTERRDRILLCLRLALLLLPNAHLSGPQPTLLPCPSHHHRLLSWSLIPRSIRNLRSSPILKPRMTSSVQDHPSRTVSHVRRAHNPTSPRHPPVPPRVVSARNLRSSRPTSLCLQAKGPGARGRRLKLKEYPAHRAFLPRPRQVPHRLFKPLRRRGHRGDQLQRASPVVTNLQKS